MMMLEEVLLFAKTITSFASKPCTNSGAHTLHRFVVAQVGSLPPAKRSIVANTLLAWLLHARSSDGSRLPSAQAL